jgi:hypothetical protein
MRATQHTQHAALTAYAKDFLVGVEQLDGDPACFEKRAQRTIAEQQGVAAPWAEMRGDVQKPEFRAAKFGHVTYQQDTCGGRCFPQCRRLRGAYIAWQNAASR